MARIRTIKPEFWTHDEVTECTPVARLLFIGLWNFADDGGVLPYRPKQIKGQVFPFDFSLGEVKAMLSELAENGLLEQYAVDGKEYIRIKGWKHQKIDQKTHKYPLPDGSIPGNKRRSGADNSANNDGNSANDSRTQTEGAANDKRTLAEHSPQEGKGCISLNISSDFDEFWGAYPRKVGKDAALKAYRKAVKSTTPKQILDGVASYKANKPDYADWAHPTTWLNQGRWADEYAEDKGKRKNPVGFKPEDWGVGVGNA